MVEHLTSIFGTEKDRVNCPFYFKIGACRHGDRCSRFHTKPSISPTLLLSNIYQRPDMITLGVNAQGQPIDPRKMQEHFEVGNVYAQFREEEHAANVLKNPSGRFYAGRPIIVDFSPVTDFCGGYCNFMHLKRIGRELRRQLFGRYRRRHSLIRSRSQSPYRHHSYDDERTHGGRGHGSRRNDDRDYHRESRSKSYWRVSPGHRRGRSRSQGGRRNRSLIREGSEESRAKIEQWNREREQAEQANKNNADNSNNYNESNDKGFIPNQQQLKHGGYRY